MATKRARIAPFLTAIGLIAAVAATTLYYRHGSTTHRAPLHTGAGTAGPAESARPYGPASEPYDSGAARLRARAALQECLQKAESAAKTSWDGMCAALAQRTSEQRDNCRQQGRAAADCRSAYAETPVTDCLLPHATASSIAQAQQSAKSDCYQQFQSEMR